MKLRTTLFCLLLLVAGYAFAQPTPTVTATQAVVPRLIRFSGVVQDASGTVGITFSLHKSQDDNAALWIETQNVPLDPSGKYTVLLGATKADGIPMDLFVSGEAQWLAIQVEGKPEQPRVLLVSVPYALKAAEAETLAGHSASEFVTADKLSTAVQQQLQTQVAPFASGTSTIGNQLTGYAVSSGATNFSGNTTDQIVKVTQSNTTGSGLVATAPAIAIKGMSTATTGTPSGVRGSSVAPTGAGVYGTNSATTGAAFGVHGSSASPGGVGVFGNNTASTGAAVGLKGVSTSPAGVAIVASETSTATNSTPIGIQATVVGLNGIAGLFASQNTNGTLISGRTGSPLKEVFWVGGSDGGVNSNGGITAQKGIYGYADPSDPNSAGVFGTNGSVGVHGVGSLQGVFGESASGTGVAGTGNPGVQGTASGSGFGISGEGGANGAGGVFGEGMEGVIGQSAASFGVGVKGTAYNAMGTAGVFANSAAGKIISGQSGSSYSEVFSVSGTGKITTAAGISTASGITSSGGISANVGSGTAITASGNYGLYATSFGTSNIAVYASGNIGVDAHGVGNGVQGAGASAGVSGTGGTYGVYGSGSTDGVHGSGSSNGVYGTGPTGVSGVSNGSGAQTGVYGYSGTDGGEGVDADNGAGGDGLFAISAAGFAAFFNGDVDVNGTLSKAAGSFKIDDPLDPQNKYLYHSFVESSDMKNMYDGTVTTDAQGNAVVELPEWFEALNRDFRYQLTTIGQPAQAWVATRVANHSFSVRTDKPNVEVSWQITGTRRDAFANAHRIPVEVEKPQNERGTYLHPELFGAPEEQGVGWARHPQAMKRFKDARLKTQRKAAEDRDAGSTAASSSNQ